MMLSDILSITEMAKLRNVTSETLRHYDRIGILSPSYISKSGYRYYSIRQYEKLGTVVELRKMGMSLKQIQQYFENRNLEKSIEILTRFQLEYEKKLEDQIHLNEEMKKKINYLESLRNLPPLYEVYERSYSERYMITLGKETGDSSRHAYAFTKLEQCLQENIPIIASDRVGIYANDSLLLENDWQIPAVPMILLTEQIDNSPLLKKIPGGRYVCILYRNGTLEKYDPCFEQLKSYIKEKHYEISGNILQIYKIDVTLTNDRNETIMEIQIPVK